jgi:hypothetical protein
LVSWNLISLMSFSNSLQCGVGLSSIIVCLLSCLFLC